MRKCDGVRVHDEKERWGISLPMGYKFTIREKGMG